MKKTENVNKASELRDHLILKRRWHEEQLELTDKQLEKILECVDRQI